MKEETTYKIETNDKNEAILMLNATRMAQALYDLLCWNRAIYNGKNYDSCWFVNGKIMSQNEYSNYSPISSGENIREIYLVDDIENKLEHILEDVKDFIYNYYE